MSSSNFGRMMEIIEGTFATREDPDQLQVDEKVIGQLLKIHPATLAEFDDGNGPAIWILIIPTIKSLMEEFIKGEISEQQLFEATKPGMHFDCIYLCSATVLPEYRRKGMALKLTIESIEKIRKDFSIETLFVWPFSEQGKLLAEKISQNCGLELKFRKVE
ncbi:hypothetical protein BH09BAC5_BH09BAC5_17110 [soil metagenome]